MSYLDQDERRAHVRQEYELHLVLSDLDRNIESPMVSQNLSLSGIKAISTDYDNRIHAGDSFAIKIPEQEGVPFFNFYGKIIYILKANEAVAFGIHLTNIDEGTKLRWESFLKKLRIKKWSQIR